MKGVSLINYIPCSEAAPGYEVEIKKHNIKGVLVDVIAIPSEPTVTLQFASKTITLNKLMPIKLTTPLAVVDLSEKEILSIAIFDLINSIGAINNIGPKLILEPYNGNNLSFSLPQSTIELAYNYYKELKGKNKYICLDLYF